MRIMPLGHAGFLVETDDFIMIMDPWLSERGCYDSAWFQLPNNHHLEAFILEKLRHKKKPRYLFISHEHRDHMDIDFLPKLKGPDYEDIHILIADYENNSLARHLPLLGLEHFTKVPHKGRVTLPGGGFVQFFIEESGINRDSGILVHADGRNFLNFNDAKLIDALADLPKDLGPIDVFTIQFSGGTWHPICYTYPAQTKAEIIQAKQNSKFESVARIIEKIQPRLFIPSAGPPMCLDPDLQRLNFERPYVFALASEFLEFLGGRLPNSEIRFFEASPGDTIDPASLEVLRGGSAPVRRHELREYVQKHAVKQEPRFCELKNSLGPERFDETFALLLKELRRKLEPLTLSSEIKVPFYVAFEEQPSRFAKVDFQKREVSESSVLEDSFYALWAPAWQIRRVLDGLLTWEDLSVTYRPRVERKPDTYNTILNGYLWVQPEDLPWFCEKMRALKAKKETLVVENQGCAYRIDRFCPHQGADLKESWINEKGLLVCPRHRWQFDLSKGGKCAANSATLNAKPLDQSSGVGETVSPVRTES